MCALAQIDDMRGREDLRIGYAHQTQARVGNEFGFRHIADADAVHDRLADGLAAADLDDCTQFDATVRCSSLEGAARRRALLACHERFVRQLFHAHILASREPVIGRHEDQDGMAAVGNGNDALVGIDVGEHGDVGLVVEQIALHGR